MSTSKRVLFMVMCTLSICSFSACIVNSSPGNGEKIGQVVRISNVGTICKTWEAQLIRGGMTDGSGSFGTVPFNFTIEDTTMVEQVQQYMRNQTEVIITYKTEWVSSFCRTESQGNFLTSITPAENYDSAQVSSVN